MKMTAKVFLVFAFGAMGVAGFLLARPSPESSPATTTPKGPSKPSRAGEFRGVCLQMHSGDPKHPYETLIDEIAGAEAKTLGLVIHGYQKTILSTAISIDPKRTPTDDRIVELIRYARSKKLSVMLMPILRLKERGADQWRGGLKPGHWPTWWEKYGEFILRYAKVAQRGGAEVFSVGSELLSTEEKTDEWRDLIRKTREVFEGRLTYSGNWDHYDVPKFWSDLDLVGMTSYHELTGEQPPKRETLLKKWGEIRGKILDWQKTVNRPILFTEAGWPNQTNCAKEPWNYCLTNPKPAPESQADCFRAFFQTWRDCPVVAGALVWEWRYSPDVPIDPKTDTSYRICGKPALKVIQEYFRTESPKPSCTQDAPSK